MVSRLLLFKSGARGVIDVYALDEAVRRFPMLLDYARIALARGARLVECVPAHYYSAVLAEYRLVLADREKGRGA
jgi:hypothetical protein